MCLPGGSSLNLTDAASKHSARVVLRCCPDGLLRSGEGLGRRGPGTVCPGEGTSFSGWQKPSFPSLLCVSGWHGGAWECFPFENNPFQSIPFLEKPQSPQQSPRPSVLKTMDLPCHPLLPWICLEQQLISCKWVWGWDFHECVRTPDSCGLTPLKYTNCSLQKVSTISPLLPNLIWNSFPKELTKEP